MKKVCHITSVHPWNDIRIFIKECSTLAANGYDVTLIAPNCENQKINNVTIIGVRCIEKNRFDRFSKTTKKIYKKALETDADIYHFHDPELIPYGLKLKKKGKIVIYDSHEDVGKQILGKYWINKYLRKIVSALFTVYENKAAKKFNFIITATPVIRDKFLKINHNTIDINNYPLLNEFKPVKNKTFNLPEICYIGGITEIRGIKQLIKAMEYTQNVTLHLAGDITPESLKDELYQMPGWKNVIEYGNVPREKCNEIMSKCIAGIVTFLPTPNHTDAQPNKMFEYMSAGLCVIGSDFALWKEIIEKNNCGYCVNPENPEEIARVIMLAVTNLENTEKMSANALRAISEKFNWEAESKKLLETYNTLY